MSKRQLAFLVDLDKCIGCQSCRVGCQVTNETSPEVNWRQVTTHLQGTFPDLSQHHLSISCNHCIDPGCMKVCPVDAIFKREEDGIVIIDQDLCNGCARCIPACPYGAPKILPDRDKVSKCHFCHDRLDRGEDPYCVQTCVGGALQYGYLDETEKKHGPNLLRQVEGFADPKWTNPSTRFLPKK